MKWVKPEKRDEAIALLKQEKRIIEENDMDLSQEQPRNSNATVSEFSIAYEDSDDENNQTDEIDKWVNNNKMKNFEDFPIMKRMHVKYNTALCSQAMVERFFSYTKLMFALRRGGLNDENFEKQSVMKANRKLNPDLFLERNM